MAKKKFISLLLTLIMLVTVCAQGVVFADDADKGMRRVYLHAQGEDPQSTPNVSTVYLGDTVDLYFAVDDPNKGDYEDGKHLEPQYDLNGYTVKVYFDPAFFDYQPTSKTSASTPIDYTIPNKNLTSSGTGEGNDVGNTPDDTIGYYIYSLGSGSDIINGKTYKTAYATIFFSGNYVPQKKDGQLWYNLCSIPLEPLKTGSTDVFLEISSGDEHSLELFAKNVSDEYPPNFNFSAVNGGYHHITIKDKLKPSPPVANPVSGTYTDSQSVELIAEDGCNIYWSNDGGVTYTLYTQPIDVERSMEIYAYAERLADGKFSSTVSFEYKIVPNPPYMFDSDKKLLPNVYTDDEKFTVYVSDKDVYGNIADDSDVYYTFSGVSVEDLKPDGTDPEKEWVKILKGADNQKIEIDRRRTVKLVTLKSSAYGTEYSDVSWYYLGIKPAPVTAEPESGLYTEKQNVTLETSTSDAEIYYTIDGGDPRTDGILYTVPLALNKDVTLRAAALYDGQWSELTSYWYVFDLEDDFGVDAFYPSGVYEGEVNVTLTPNNPDNKIVYSTDGGKSWTDYTDTITVNKDTEIIAKAVTPEGKEGEEYKFNYTIKPLPPLFAPESTQFTNADKISIYCVERTDDNYSKYELYYTLDGTDPTTSKTAILADEVSDSADIRITDYTVVTAVVKRDGTTYSSVVTHSYDIVVSKPVRPLTTLLPGYYTREIGREPFETKFVPVPAGTKIYYTISHGDSIMPDPVPGAEGTFEYNGESIEIKGHTIIKAVAVNSFGAKSDIGVFDYVITPESPVAAPSATVGGNKLPVVPVHTVEGSTVNYNINGFENELVANEEIFYIDTATGNAYEDEECQKPLGKTNSSTIKSPAILHIYATLDGVSSEPNTYVYSSSNNTHTLAPPYADKETGVYEEIKISDNNNNLLAVNLYSLNDGDEIQYMKDNDGNWETYSSTLFLKKDTVLQLRAKKGEDYSTVATYVYEFVPLAPIITLPSGTYSATPSLPITTLELDSRAPSDVDYSIMYRANGDKSDVLYTEGTEREIEHTMSFKAYVINEDTGKRSANTIHYYIIESNAISGSVYTAYPYEVNPGDTKYIASYMLSEKDYNQGIKLYTQNKDAKIRYFYSYTKADGSGTAASETYIYDNDTPIFVNSSMKDITITAWLIDKDGNQIEDSTNTFNYVFVDTEIPIPSLEELDKTEFPKNTEYTIHEYTDDGKRFIYYTLDGSNPEDEDNEGRLLYDGSMLKLTGNTTVKTVYFYACGGCGQCKNDNPENCTRGVYGKTGTYKYSIPTKVGGGGGGGGGTATVTIDNTRKYTKDIFGNEHPTHIGYIKGYPDGSVKPNGYITREEMTTILYRIKNKQYEKPFVSTGEIFSDVAVNRWSVTEIEYMADKGYVTGYPDGEFKPSRYLTRAEFAALIFRFAEIEDNKNEYKFSDLESEHWAYDEIMSLCRAGLMEGYEDGTFKPENNISRAEVMTVVNKILGRNPSEEYVKSLGFNPFNDLESSKWYYVTVLEATITHNYYLDKNDVEYIWEDWK